MAEKATLGYWKIRGLAQPIRLMLNYAGVEFDETYYEVGDAPDYSREEWYDVKDNLDLEFANLPYYIDSDHKVTNCGAILRYLGRKYNLGGTTEKERIRVDIIAEELNEFRSGLIRLCYLDYKMLRPKYKKDLPKKLKPISDYLGKNDYLAGDHISFVDFMLYELLDVHNTMFPECLGKFSNLSKLVTRIESIPQIKDYLASPKFLKAPINNKIAKCYNDANKVEVIEDEEDEKDAKEDEKDAKED